MARRHEDAQLMTNADLMYTECICETRSPPTTPMLRELPKLAVD